MCIRDRQQALGEAYAVSSEPMMSQIGSGALPVDQLPSHGLAIRPVRTGPDRAADKATDKATDKAADKAAAKRPADPLGALEKRLRGLPRPVIGRIANDTLWLDLRCLEDAHCGIFTGQLGQLRP